MNVFVVLLFCGLVVLCFVFIPAFKNKLQNEATIL